MPRDDQSAFKKFAEAAKDRQREENPLPELAPITESDLLLSNLTPRVIVPYYMYADVRLRIAAGGTGKTTLALYEAMQLALGRPLWGSRLDNEVRTVIVTKEDRRETLVARLNCIMEAHDLTDEDVQTVLKNVVIYDLTSIRFRLSCIIGDVVEVSEAQIDWMVERLFGFKPDWIIFDPLVSFGVGEGRVNDAEQGLIDAFRYIIRKFDCCTEGIHHTGKQNARGGTDDQYSGRGGSALSDGARMIVVLNPVTPTDWNKECGTPLANDEVGIKMSLPKLSYCAPQETVYIRRKGYRFDHESTIRRTPEQQAEAAANQLYQFILDQYRQGRKYSKEDLSNKKGELSMSRDVVRAAMSELQVSGRVRYEEVRGKSGSHFVPIE